MLTPLRNTSAFTLLTTEAAFFDRLLVVFDSHVYGVETSWLGPHVRTSHSACLPALHWLCSCPLGRFLTPAVSTPYAQAAHHAKKSRRVSTCPTSLLCPYAIRWVSIGSLDHTGGSAVEPQLYIEASCSRYNLAFKRLFNVLDTACSQPSPASRTSGGFTG